MIFNDDQSIQTEYEDIQNHRYSTISCWEGPIRNFTSHAIEDPICPVRISLEEMPCCLRLVSFFPSILIKSKFSCLCDQWILIDLLTEKQDTLKEVTVRLQFLSPHATVLLSLSIEEKTQYLRDQFNYDWFMLQTPAKDLLQKYRTSY